jgi:hypothetical protein
MKTGFRKSASIMLSLLLVMTAILPGFSVFAAGPSITVTDSNGNEVTERIEVQEYRSVQLGYTLSGDIPDGAYVEWSSNLPLLADVDESGKITGYDYSKAAIIQLWLDENVRNVPLVGNTMASAIENAIFNSGYDLETVNTDILVALVRGIAGESIANSLRNYLDNMNVVVTATLYSANGTVLATDSVDVLVTQSTLGSLTPTGIHITNKKTVPKTVAVGATVQLYGAVTPVRLKQGVKWTVGSSALDNESSKHATVDSNGLVTFTSPGRVTVRVNPSSTIYGLYSDTVSFTVVSNADLPVTDFSISGDTSVAEGETTALAIDNVAPAGAYTGSVVWSSSDESIAVVDSNGIVTGLDGGNGLVFNKSVTITASIDGVSKSVTVTVTRSLISSNLSAIEISGESVVANDGSAQYRSTVYPARLNTNSSVLREWGLEEDGNVVWATNSVPAENSLATITSGGYLTAKASGVITIRARATYNNSSVETSFQVLSGKAITDFTITGSRTVTENKTVQLSISDIMPADYDQALLSTVKWSSADPTIASVDANGVVYGLDAGGYGNFNSQGTTIYATISGVTKSFDITVNGAWINYITSAEINGFDNVIRDFPVQYQAVFTPDRMSISSTLWGLPTDSGNAPWTASNYVMSASNTANSIASVSSNGTVTGLSAGSTTLYLYGRHNFTSHNEATKKINVVEVEPQSITVTAPTKRNYVEGETQLDLSGLKVELTYNRAALEPYYGDTTNLFTEDQLKVEVSDYTVSEINQSVLDAEQYIVVSVVRAGRTYRGIFSITLESKDLTSIDITPPQRNYLEGVTALDLYGLTVKANYSNAPSEFVSDYTVDTDFFDPTLYNVEQLIRVSYTHAGRSAEAYFPVIVYGIPVVTVDTGGYTGGWTSEDVVFTLDSTNQLDGVTYYYWTYATGWQPIDGNTFNALHNKSESYIFKAVNGAGIESAETQRYTVRHDATEPSFSLIQGVTQLTNQSYYITINDLQLGISGLKSITVNGADQFASQYYTVTQNGTYVFTVTGENGLSHSESIVIDNIDKTAPAVNSVTLNHKNDGTVARIINGITFGTFFNRQIEITVDAADVGVAGIESIEYRFLDENGTPLNAEWLVYNENNKPVQDPDFKGYVQARATDRAGNVSEFVCSDGYVIDESNPSDVVITASSKGAAYSDGEWTSDDVVISLESEAFSGIYEYLYRVDGGAWQSLDGNTLTVSGQGEYLYEFMSVSNAALDSNVSSINVRIDRQTPVIRVSFLGSSGRWTGEDIEFHFNTLEPSLSGITYYYSDGTGWYEISTGNMFVIAESTNSVYQFKAVNGAGTQSHPSDEYIVMIDSQLPEINVEQTVTEPTCVAYDLLISTVSGASGIKSVVLNGQDITGKDRITVSENGNYLFTVTGNTQKTTTYLLVIDNFYTPVFEISGIDFERAVSGGYSAKENGVTFFNEPTVIDIDVTNTGVNPTEVITYQFLDENGNTVGSVNEFDSAGKPVISDNFSGFIKAVAYDTAGNASDEYISAQIIVETAAPDTPSVNAISDGKAYISGQKTNKEISLSLDSTAFSGIDAYKYRIDGGAWATLEGNGLTALSGVHTYEFKAVSKAGNESGVTVFTTDYDASLPNPTVKVANGLCAYYSQSVSIPVSIYDNQTLSSYSAAISFDPAALRIDGISNAADGSLTYSVDSQNGIITVNFNSASVIKPDSVRCNIEATVLTENSEDTLIGIISAETGALSAVLEGASLALNPASTVSTVSVYNLAGKRVKQLSVQTGADVTFAAVRQQADAYAVQKENKNFIGWADANGRLIDDSMLIYGNLSIYPVYEDTVILEGAYVLDRNSNGGSYLKGLVSEGTTAAEIREWLDNDYTQILVFKDGVLLGENELVGTGCVVKCVSTLDSNTVYDTATVILKGDLDGDGLPTDTDYGILLGTLSGADSLTEIQSLAADIDNDGAADGFDVFCISMYLANLADLPLI